jgi:glutamate racemase
MFMQKKDKSNPIGIFDSGIGGLTVAQTISNLMPNENIVYFGDTAHTPWGDKSQAVIQAYCLKICDFLLEYNCKCIVMACHTASSAAFELVQDYVGDKACVLNVIDPVVHHIGEYHGNKKIGLIGTKQTVRSNTYKQRLESLNQNIELSSLATPLLVPLIEEGFFDKPVSEMIVSEYLSHPNLLNIHALILGCTHYPLIKHFIQNFYQTPIDIIDASEVTAHTLKAELQLRQLLNEDSNSNRLFYVSDFNEFCCQTTHRFFQGTIQLQPYPLWDLT